MSGSGRLINSVFKPVTVILVQYVECAICFGSRVWVLVCAYTRWVPTLLQLRFAEVKSCREVLCNSAITDFCMLNLASGVLSYLQVCWLKGPPKGSDVEWQSRTWTNKNVRCLRWRVWQWNALRSHDSFKAQMPTGNKCVQNVSVTISVAKAKCVLSANVVSYIGLWTKVFAPHDFREHWHH